MKLSTQILLAFAIVLLLSIIDTLSNYVLSLKVEENASFLNRSQDIIRNSGKLHKEIIEMQSSFRGFLLTDDADFLDDYDKRLKIIPVLFKEQEGLVKNNPEQLMILDSIQILHQLWTGYADSLINARQEATLGSAALNRYNSI
ncbi:MAG: CHASE3 domain-containing protein [Flavobacterium sp.]